MAPTIVRDPLWNTIRLDPAAVRIIDTPEFQRLRLIRQLGLAYLVYPGATHTRFDHALGVYHLARWAMGLLADRGELQGVDPIDCKLAPYAALLHDVGHYPFSHALEELGEELIPLDHEALAERFDVPSYEGKLGDIFTLPDTIRRAVLSTRWDSPAPLGCPRWKRGC